MSSKRWIAATVLSACSGLAVAQHDGGPTKEPPNWPVSPFWAAPQSIALEKVREQGVIDAMAIEAVPTPPLPLIGVNPCRVADTRGNGFTGAYGSPSLIAGSPRNFALAGQCGIAAGAQAISLNITVTNTLGPGFILIYPQGGSQPTVSTLNYVAGQTIANAAIVPLGSGGGVTVIAGVSGTDLIIDTNGYFAPQTVVNTLNGLSSNVSLAAGSSISITPSGQTLTIAATLPPPPPAAWSLSGNAGTAPGTNFLGTTDEKALEFKVNGQRAFRIEPTTGAPNVVGGHSSNVVSGNVFVHGATIAGGGDLAASNSISDDFGTIGGGLSNRVGNLNLDPTDVTAATVGGGSGNVASSDFSTVAGGEDNFAAAAWAAIGGGSSNVAGGYAAIPGGFSNSAAGNYSLAAGRQAKANHQGAFVWGDSTAADVASTGANQFVLRASGGIWLGTTSTPSFAIATDFLRTSTGAHLTIGGVWTDNSDRNSKENFQEVDKREILSRVVSLPITRWNYKAEGCETEHLGPMAQDFATAFRLGSDDRSISTLDSSGVALAAIQALYEEVQQLRKRVAELEAAKN